MWKFIFYISCYYLSASVLGNSEVTYTGPRYVEEGSTFIITCRLSAGYNLKWTKNYEKLSGPEYNMTVELLDGVTQISNLIVRNAQANHSGDYRCYTFIQDQYHEISVIFDMEGKSNVVELLIDKNTSLHCSMTQDSTVNITWSKNGVVLDIANSNGKYERMENNTLVITKGTYDDAGTYACAVGGANITFYAKTKVRVEKFEKSINAVQGDKLTLTCKAYSNPPPSVIWYKDDVPIKEANSTQHIKFQDANNLTDSLLVIEQLEENDRAQYSCYVYNDINNVTVSVMVRVKDKLAALWPFLGILAEVVVLCTIIFIYEKRRAKLEYDESDTDPNNESKPSTEQKKEDVRQRK